MKKFFLFLAFSLFLSTFNSCKLNDGYSDYTPKIVLFNPAQLNSDSALYFKSTTNVRVGKIDSLHVGDTLRLKIGMDAYLNTLIQFDYSINDTAAFKAIIPDSIKSVFESMDYSKGKFLFDPRYSVVILPIDFIALKQSDSISCAFKVYSNAVKVSNEDAIGFVTKIKPQ
ncbi:MAG: hypothetical protein ACK5L7_04845 [Paludibacteraceae bacterium]